MVNILEEEKNGTALVECSKLFLKLEWLRGSWVMCVIILRVDKLKRRFESNYSLTIERGLWWGCKLKKQGWSNQKYLRINGLVVNCSELSPAAKKSLVKKGSG